MNKNKKIIISVIVILVAFIAGFLIYTSKPADAIRNINITVSSQLQKTDVESYHSVYTREYENYELKDEYEYYSCIAKIENNSDSEIYNAEFKSVTKDNFRIDFHVDYFDQFSIRPGATEYVTMIISVKKGISQDELNAIVNDLPKTIKLSFAHDDSLDYDFTVRKKYKVVNDDYSKEEIQERSFI